MKRVILLLVGALLLLSMSCVTVNVGVEKAEIVELQRESRVVEYSGDGDEVRVNISLGAGDLEIDGGADEFLEADFSYNVLEWKPEVEYEGDRLKIAQPHTHQVPFDSNVRYEWDLQFNDDIPMEMRVDFGAGEGNLDFGSLAVTLVDFKIGAGDVTIDLNGNRTLERLELDMGAGDIEVDLRGNWEHDVAASIQGGVGQATIYLPDNIGVKVNVDKGLGGISADGFRRDGNSYVNALYGESEITLMVNVQAGIGQVNLILD
ncbi:MAG: hypothetical protein JXB35_01345 [Anaerolineae bacterium]|nr:hypothetical protein [Anaerolineae bacterium]